MWLECSEVDMPKLELGLRTDERRLDDGSCDVTKQHLYYLVIM